ncbi:MAG TPA: hypothetical protein VFK34_11860 [Marmoricola sp.]|nr:hypothetical protein [Marmoricola sp.]
MIPLFVPLHGLGGGKDLPIPAPLAIAGGTAALIVSFCVLILAWRRPRYEPAGPGLRRRWLDRFDSDGFRWTLRLLGLVAAGYAAIPLLWGDDVRINPALGVFYVLVWVGIVPASLLFGRVVAAVSPLRTINLLLVRVTGGEPEKGVLRYPERWGYWPAAIGLFAFVWQELVNPDQTYLDSVRLWLAGYAAAMLIGSAVFGDVWFERADPFEVYSNLLAKLSPWGRDQHGRLVVRTPLANLATTVPRPGLVAVVAVLFGSTAFDSYRDTARWARFSQGGFASWLEDKPFRGALAWLAGDTVLVNALALLLFCLVIGVSFTVAARLTAVEGDVRRRDLPNRLAHSVIPIIVGYMTAHYLSYFVEQGQITITQLSDPLTRGDDWLGTGDWSVNIWLTLHPTVLASIKVLAVVLGHVLGVIAAHDRALTLLPRRHQVVGQLGLLVIMVAYTATGLYLLFGG